MRILSLALAAAIAPLPAALSECGEPPPESDLTLSNPTWVDEDGDGLWEAGERLVVTVEISNDGETDDCAYPGVTLVEDSSYASIGNGEAFFYCVLAGTSMEAAFNVDAATFFADPNAVAPAAHDVNFIADVTHLNCGVGSPCPAPSPLSFTIPIER